MKTANYDFILPFFTSRDTLRPTYQQIHLHENGYVYATEGHVLIKVPASECMLTYGAVDKFPNAEAMFEKFQFAQQAKIYTNELVEILAAFKWVRQHESENCEKCGGDGTITCKCCDNESECKECNGAGNFVKGVAQCSLLTTSQPYTMVKIAHKTFNADMIHILCICAKMVGCDVIQLSYNHEQYDPYVFTVGYAQILIMPSRINDEYEIVREIAISKIK